MTGEDNIAFRDACNLLERVLKGNARQAILDDLKRADTPPEGLLHLRDCMRSAHFCAGSETFDFRPLIRQYDSQIPNVGFHVLKDWDGKAERLNDDVIAVDMAQYFIGLPLTDYSYQTALPLILDYYFMYILALLSVNAWRDGDPISNLNRVADLLADLQGEEGSGHRFAGDAETLILIATSHFEADEPAYCRLLTNVSQLSSPQRVRVALAQAAIHGSHLRHGFQDLYKRDFTIMRDDNCSDYPWLFFAVSTLMKEYIRLRENATFGTERNKVLEGLINGLTADARALISAAPASLADYKAEHAEFRNLFYKYREDLLQELDGLRPSDRTYSPLGFNFNFPHNVVKGSVANAIVRGRPSTLTLNDLLTGFPYELDLDENRKTLAYELVEQAKTSPDIIRGKPVAIFSYDPYRAVRIFSNTMHVLRDAKKPLAATLN